MPEQKFKELVDLMNRLRIECPWDKEQTHDSIKEHTIEEAFEVVEAIDDKNYDELKSELGDLLLHIVFHSKIAEDEGHFTLSEVIESINSKLIRRHPHVFGDTVVNSNSDIERNWEIIKLEEGRDSVIEGVPKNLPSLNRAFKLQKKVSKVGFDWDNKDQVWEKIEEELREFRNAAENGSQDELEEELGDILFSIVNYSRFLNIAPEAALRKTNEKFIRRFGYVEKRLKEAGVKITDATLEQMDSYWEESKKEL